MASGHLSLPVLVILPSSITNEQGDIEPPGDLTKLSKPGGAPTESIDHVADLGHDDWDKLVKLNGILRAWKGEYSGSKLSIHRAPKPALALKDEELEFEVSDDSFTETRESSTRIERDMTLKGFTESRIHAALAGGAHGLTLGLGGNISWHTNDTSDSRDTSDITTIHGFYNFPRVTIHLEPGSLKLSDACVKFMKKHKNNENNEEVLKEFFQQFGGMLATRVALGGRLCTKQEVKSEQQSIMIEEKNEMKSQLTATVITPGGGLSIGGNRSKGSTSTDQGDLSDNTKHMLIKSKVGIRS
jgi:hypothetical protein